MHELWLCARILEIATEHAQKQKCQKIKKIVVEVGQLQAVDQESLRFSFDIIACGTPAEGALLETVVVSATALCADCQEQVPVTQYYDACPRCGGYALTVTQGEGMQVHSMVVE